MAFKRGWYVVAQAPHYFEDAGAPLCGGAFGLTKEPERFDVHKDLGVRWQCKKCQAALSPTHRLFLENGEVVEEA